MADYNNVYKDKCAVEFMKLKECFLVSQYRGRFWRWRNEKERKGNAELAWEG